MLDLFCGAGGAAMGLHRAWPEAEIVGVDIKPQPRYPFKLWHKPVDVFDFFEDNFRFGQGWDFIWASPPCQAFSIASRKQRNEGTKYPDYIERLRVWLERYRKHFGCGWVIENVPGAPVRPDFILCGSNFGLPIARHRLFETSFANGTHAGVLSRR